MPPYTRPTQLIVGPRPENDILRKTYNAAFELDRLGFTTWVTAPRMILQKNGFNYVWLKQGITDYADSSEFFTKLAYSLTGQSEQLFFSKIWNDVDGKTTKLDFYRSYKDTYKFENYLDETKNFKYRRSLTRLRLSNHSLRIETRRYVVEERHERVCQFCDETVIENEKTSFNLLSFV